MRAVAQIERPVFPFPLSGAAHRLRERRRLTEEPGKQCDLAAVILLVREAVVQPHEPRGVLTVELTDRLH